MSRVTEKSWKFNPRNELFYTQKNKRKHFWFLILSDNYRKKKYSAVITINVIKDLKRVFKNKAK